MDIPSQLLEDFKANCPVLFKRVNSAVDAMKREAFDVVISPSIQDRKFSWKSVKDNPPCVYLNALPTDCIQNTHRNGNDVPITIHRVFMTM